jgi:hypothetical protein
MHLRSTLLASLVALLLAAPQARSSQTGGLASPVGPSRLALSATLGYGERDVEDGRDDQVTTRRVLVRAQFGVIDGLDVYATVGLGDVDFDHADFSGSLGESFGAGVRYGLLHFRESGMKLVLDAQGEYLRSSDSGERVGNQTYHAAAFLVKELGAAGRVGYLFPYGGVRVSYARYDGSGLDDYTGKDFLGVFGGVDYFVNPNVFFSAEAHLFDEMGLYLGAGYRF